MEAAGGAGILLRPLPMADDVFSSAGLARGERLPSAAFGPTIVPP